MTLTTSNKNTVNNVLDFVELKYGKKGLEMIASDFSNFAKFMQEYNDQFVSTFDKIMNLREDASKVFFKQLATETFIKFHTINQNKKLTEMAA